MTKKSNKNLVFITVLITDKEIGKDQTLATVKGKSIMISTSKPDSKRSSEGLRLVGIEIGKSIAKAINIKK